MPALGLAQDPASAPATQIPSAAQAEVAPVSTAAPIRSEFHIRYITGQTIYLDGGRSAGLTEGTKLVIKLDPARATGSQAVLEPGIVAKLTVISVASVSAVCEVNAASRELAEGEVVTLPEDEVEKLVTKDAIGNTRKYPMVVTFSEGDPLDEEVRDAQPRPPLPEVNQIRGRVGFDYSNIRQLGQNGSTSASYGFVFRGDITRIRGTHWNLNGYWRGSLQHSASQYQTLFNSLNRTYVLALTYVNPDSKWTASVGRLYVPWASSLDVIDGGFVGHYIAPKAVLGLFAGSAPDPSAYNYNPNRRIGGLMLNFHGGSYEAFHFSSTVGGGVNTLKWDVTNPFGFTENELSYKRYISVYHSMQIDEPDANPGSKAVGLGIGRSMLSLRAQVHPRVTLDITHTYFRDIPTYDANLVGTGLLDKYLYQGINGGARLTLPYHLLGYVSLGQSNNSSDKKDSLNKLYGLTLTHIWKTGLVADARYSKFDSAFASGVYRTFMLSRDIGERFRLNAQGGRYSYSSSLATNNNSNFVNIIFDTNLGSRMFVESMFTTQRGGSTNYNQWINTFGYRFDNRSRHTRRFENAQH
jgi:hypothetical protein